MVFFFIVYFLKASMEAAAPVRSLFIMIYCF